MTPTFIMAVPWLMERAKRAVALSRETGGTVVWDRNRNAFDTWRSALSAAEQGAAVIMEDDVVLAPAWRRRVEEVIAERPGDVIQFFSMRKDDIEIGSRYVAGSKFMATVCHYLPAGVAHSLLLSTADWPERHPEHPTGTDLAVAEWLKGQGLRYWNHVPSLVQHEGWRSAINPRRPRNRRSLTFEEPA